MGEGWDERGERDGMGEGGRGPTRAEGLSRRF